MLNIHGAFAASNPWDVLDFAHCLKTLKQFKMLNAILHGNG